MDFGWSETEEQFRRDVGRLLDEVMEEVGVPKRPGFLRALEDFAPADQLRLGKEVCGRLAERGYLTPSWPREYGGLELTPWQSAILAEEVIHRGEPRGSQYMNLNWIGPAIMYAGTSDQKDYFLKRISRGDITWCQGFSEPDAGTDLASLRTTAVRDGEEYVVNGEKIWTSHTPTAEYCFLLVRTDPAAERHAGISILLVPLDTPGFAVRTIEGIGDIHDSAFGSLVFTDMRVPVTARLGEENQGWELVKRALAFERVGMPRWLSALTRLREIEEWAEKNDRLDGPGVRESIGQAVAACESARVLYYAVVNERAKSLERPSPLTFVARALMARAERAVSECSMTVLEEHSLVRNAPGGAYVDGIVAGLAAGSYEVQLNLIARQVLSLS